MRLKRLTISRLPGIDQSFEIESAGAGIYVIFGPNAIGKSSICRAVEGLYWGDRGPTQQTLVTAQFEVDGKMWQAVRDGARLRWRCGDQDRVPLAIPGSHNHRCFFLRLQDLIDPSLEGTHDIASEIRRQMSGGFDLSQIVKDLFPALSNQRSRAQRQVFNNAARDVLAAEGKQLGLQRRADQLADLEAKRQAAVASARRLPSVERAVRRAIRKKEHSGVVAEIAVLPDSLANLTGQEVKEITRLQDQIDQLDTRARDLDGERNGAREARRESRLPAEVSKSELEVCRNRAEELKRIELQLQTATTHCAQCRQEVSSALSALGGGDVDEVALTVREHGQLFEFLRAAEKHRAQKSTIEWRLRLLEHIEHSEDDQSRLHSLRGAIDALRTWLRAPKPETLQDRLRARYPWILLALAMMVAGVVLSMSVDPLFGLLLAAGAGIMAPVVLLRGTNSASGSRAHAEDVFATLDIEALDSWDAGSVESRLRNLEGEVASIDSRLQRARDRDVERQNLNSEFNGLAEAEPLLAERRNNLLENLKLNAMTPDAELVDFARALDRLCETRIKYDGAAGQVDALKTTHAQLLSCLTDVLQRHGEPVPKDATTATVYLNDLSERNAQLVKALDDGRRVHDQLKLVSADQEAALNALGQVYKKASLDHGDLAGLTALLKLLPKYRELKRKDDRLKAQIDLDREELESAGEAELVNYERRTLDRLKDEFAVAENNADKLQRVIVEIEAQVHEANRSTNLQDLITRKEKSRADLQDLRDEALFAQAGRFLVSTVEKEYEQNQMPRVLERARGHFSNFTHHGYELRLSRDTQAPRLLAVDLPSGEEREINELSDGTRAQLLLAARVAFAEEVEQERTPLPLFFDEALDQSDPARFEAIARSLGRLAKDQGRQIFYLTSDPQDRDRFRHALEAEKCVVAAEIDLGLIRRKTASVTGPTMLQVPLRSVVPAPDGASTEEYGVTLGVPAFAPALGYAPQHFFYVLFDDLNLLRDFLVNSIEHAGQWKTVSGTPLAEKLGARSITSQEIDSRVSLLGVFCDAWNQGRSRAIDRDVLVESGAVSPRYLDYVVAISGELEGDPERLLAVLRAKNDLRLRGFRQRSVETLEGYLRDNGYLDDRPVLEESELTLRALASPPANELPDDVASDCLRRWWVWATKMSDGSE